MIINIILLVVGFILLIKGADIFVDGASSLASNLHVSKMLIALTIVAFGTSAPELAVSIKGVISNSSDIVIGNVIGSNILNILLILGISSLFSKLKVNNNIEIPYTILISILLMLLINDNVISKTDGLVIILFFSIFIYYLISISKDKKSVQDEPEFGIIKSILFTLVGMISVIFGSNLVVDNAVDIAKLLNVSERIISLTIIAFGTSLPELITSVSASIKHESDIAIGNIIGSNIFNIGIVIGIPSIIKNINCTFNIIDIMVMIFSAVLLYIMTRKKELNYKNGIIMLIIFIVYYSYVVGGI